jgi:hypothetical protein
MVSSMQASAAIPIVECFFVFIGWFFLFIEEMKDLC